MCVRHTSVEGTAGEDSCERVVLAVSPEVTAWATRDGGHSGREVRKQVSIGKKYTLEASVALAVYMWSFHRYIAACFV